MPPSVTLTIQTYVTCFCGCSDQALVDANIKRIEELLFELDEGRLDFDVSLSLAAQIRLSQAKIEELEALFDEREQTILALGEQERTQPNSIFSKLF